MKFVKNTVRSVAASAGLLLMGATPALTRAATVFNTLTGDQAIDQQTGNNFYYLGDGATIAPTSQALTTIQIPFGSSSLGGAPFTYTPDLELDLYPTATDALNFTNQIGSRSTM